MNLKIVHYIIICQKKIFLIIQLIPTLMSKQNMSMVVMSINRLLISICTFYNFHLVADVTTQYLLSEKNVCCSAKTPKKFASI